MTVKQKQYLALETLRVFNQAVTTSRLYPALSPQVSNAVEKAYQEIKNFSRKQGELSFSNSSEGPLICGLQVAEELQTDFTGLIIFRHLELLKLEHVVLRPNFDRPTFSRILTVFTSRKEKINREGGGRPFVNGLNLDHFFPDTYAPPPQENADVEKKPDSGPLLESTVLPKGVLGYLFGEHQREDSLVSVKGLLRNTLQASQVIVAGIARVLEHLNKVEYKDILVVSASYTRFFDTVGRLLPEEGTESALRSTVATLIENGGERMLCILFVQRYPEGFGQMFFEQLAEATPNELFDRVILSLRERMDLLIRQKAENSAQAGTVREAVDKLLATRKGKQFIGREKAQQLIQAGEKQRQSRRLETGIKALLGGSTESLKSDEIVFSLPATIEELVAAGQVDEAGLVIEKVASEMLGGDDVLRRRLIQSLILIGEKLLDDKRWDWLEKITGALISWVRESDEGDFVFEKTVAILQAVMTHAWTSGNFNRGDQILSIFHKIRSGELQKSPPVVALIGRIQDRYFNRPQLEQLLGGYLSSSGDSQSGERLGKLGRPAGIFLIDSLLAQEESSARLKIIELLTRMGKVILPTLLEKLHEPMPWFGKRNLIKLASDIAGPGDAKVIMPFLRHDDLRVQKEAFVCLYRISQGQRKKVLLDALHESSEIMRAQIVKALLPFSDDETAEHLGVLLRDQEHYTESIREPLILEILRVLSRSGSMVGRNALQDFLENKNKKANRKLSDRIWQTAKTALKQIESVTGPAAPAISGSSLQVAEPVLPKKAEAIGNNPDKKPESSERKISFAEMPGASQIRELLSQGKNELARDSILDKIGKSARAREFEQAESFRKWLIEIDPMALTEIIRAAELIEEEKVASIDKYYIEVWSELSDALSTEEFATLYHAMKRKAYGNEELIVRQGSMQSALYFIASGKVKVFYQDNGSEILIKTATQGEILGAETVFDSTVWTVSAACLTKAEVMILEIGQLMRWREEYPSLESKLSDFCMKSQSLKKFFAMSGKDRRTSARQKIGGRISTMLLDSKGNDTGITSKGDLVDAAVGGVSFYLRISQKKNARLLLGRNIRVMIPMQGVAAKHIGVEGTIIAVRGHQAMENEYSVHIKFKEHLSATDFQGIIKTGKESLK